MIENIGIWMDTNAPKRIENTDFYRQKLNYIHENLARKGYVARPEHWLWSSANPASVLSVRFIDAWAEKALRTR